MCYVCLNGEMNNFRKMQSFVIVLLATLADIWLRLNLFWNPEMSMFIIYLKLFSGTFLVYQITKRMIFDVTVHGILQKCMKLIIHKTLLNPQSYNSYMKITTHLYYMFQTIEVLAAEPTLHSQTNIYFQSSYKKYQNDCKW